jgi:hypothetical protein
MIEVNKTYEFLPGIDKQAYRKNAKKWRERMLRVPGLVELHSQRNILGSPQVRLTLMWKTLAHWGKFAESTERWAIEAELRNYAKNIRIEIWQPSPAVPKSPHACE